MRFTALKNLTGDTCMSLLCMGTIVCHSFFFFFWYSHYRAREWNRTSTCSESLLLLMWDCILNRSMVSFMLTAACCHVSAPPRFAPNEDFLATVHDKHGTEWVIMRNSRLQNVRTPLGDAEVRFSAGYNVTTHLWAVWAFCFSGTCSQGVPWVRC